MKHTGIVLSLVMLVCAAAVRAQPDIGGEQVDPWAVCLEDVKTDDKIISHTFNFASDQKTALRLARKLAAHLTCQGMATTPKDACKNILRMDGFVSFDADFAGKDGGAAVAQCEWLTRFSAFWWEVKSAGKTQKNFPACVAYLGSIKDPAPFFDTSAKAPRSTSNDPANDGGFWNVCRGIADDLRAGRANACADPRIPYFRNKGVPAQLWDQYCRGWTDLWVTGDDAVCALQGDKADHCRAEAELVKAYRSRRVNQCPEGKLGVSKGVCSFYLGGKGGVGCRAVWDDLVSDFCTERSQVPLDQRAPKPGSIKGPDGQ